MNARNDTMDPGFDCMETGPAYALGVDTGAPGRGQLAAALAKAQCEMSNPSFDRENPHFRNRFASLAAVRNAVVPILAKHGIAVVQDLTTTEKGISCRTLLMHTSGEVQSFGPLTMPAMKPDAQGLGSAATYARRYHLMAVAGVVGDDDDDANAAVDKPAASTMKADPRGDLGKKVDTKLANKWATALRDQQDDEHRLADIWNEVKEDHDLAIVVWDSISAALKAKIKAVGKAAT